MYLLRDGQLEQVNNDTDQRDLTQSDVLSNH